MERSRALCQQVLHIPEQHHTPCLSRLDPAPICPNKNGHYIKGPQMDKGASVGSSADFPLSRKTPDETETQYIQCAD